MTHGGERETGQQLILLLLEKIRGNYLTDFEMSWMDGGLIKVDLIFSTYLVPWHDFNFNLINS